MAVITPLLASDVDRMQAMIDLNVTALMRLAAAADLSLKTPATRYTRHS